MYSVQLFSFHLFSQKKSSPSQQPDSSLCKTKTNGSISTESCARCLKRVYYTYLGVWHIYNEKRRDITISNLGVK